MGFFTSTLQYLKNGQGSIIIYYKDGWIPTYTDSNNLFLFIMKASRKYFTPKNDFFHKLKFSENSHNNNTTHKIFGNFTEDVVC